MKTDKYKIRLILIFITLLLFVLNFAISLKNKSHHVFPSPVTVSLNAMAISVDELVNGSNGYIGNRDLLEAFLKDKEILKYNECKKNKEYCFVENINIKKIVKLAEQSDKKPRLIYENEDIGLIDYYKIAFLLFGFNIFSLISTYYLILFLSLIFWIFAFHKEPTKLFIPNLFLLSHSVIIYLLPSFGDEIIVAHSRRFLPALSVIPTFFLIITLIENKFVSLKYFILNILQIIILIFIIHSRSTAIFQLLNIGFFMSIMVFINRNQLRIFLSKKRFFTNTTLSILLMLIFYKFLMFVNLNPLYSTVVSKYLFWHSAYIGLSSHPNAKLKYKIYADDNAASDYVADYSQKKLGDANWKKFMGFEGYERVLKERYFEILKTDTSFFLYNYLKKPFDFLKLFYENVLKKILWPMFFIFVFFKIFFNLIKFRYKDIIDDQLYFYVFLTLAFSFLPSFLLVPSLDYSLITMILCVLITFYICFKLICFKLLRLKK